MLNCSFKGETRQKFQVWSADLRPADCRQDAAVTPNLSTCFFQEEPQDALHALSTTARAQYELENQTEEYLYPHWAVLTSLYLDCEWSEDETEITWIKTEQRDKCLMSKEEK